MSGTSTTDHQYDNDTWPATTIPWLTMIYGVREDVADTPQLRSSMRQAVARLQLDGLVCATRLLHAAGTPTQTG